jgi:excisionase family DNA binding protein
MKKHETMNDHLTVELDATPVMHARKTFLTVPELAEYLRVSVSTVRNRMREGSIPRKKVFGRVLFDLEEINEWVKAHGDLDHIIRKASVYDMNQRIARRDPAQPLVFTLD